RGGGGRGRGLDRRPRGLGGGLRGAVRLEREQRAALLHAVAELDPKLAHDAAERGRHLHGRLVRLQRDQRLLRLDGVAGLHKHLDDRHVLEVADVGNQDLLDRHLCPRGQTVTGLGFSGSMPYLWMAWATALRGTLPSSTSRLSAASTT